MADNPQPPLNPAPPPGAPPPAYGPPPGYAPQGYYPVQPYAVPAPSNGAAVAAMVLGIVGVVLCWIPFIDFVAAIVGILAIVFGVVGSGRANRIGTGKGMAIAGIVLGIIAVAITVLFVVLVYGALIGLHHAVTSGLPNVTSLP